MITLDKLDNNLFQFALRLVLRKRFRDLTEALDPEAGVVGRQVKFMASDLLSKLGWWRVQF